MKQLSDLDYVELYAKKLKNDNSLFAQQKTFIESQMKASSSFFSNMFSKKNFEEEARKYLKSVKII